MTENKRPSIPGLEEAAKRIAAMTPEEKQEFQAKIRRQLEEEEQDAEDQRWKRGKYDPTLHPVGWCYVCKLKTVVEKWSIHHYGESFIGGRGGRSNAVMGKDGLYCLGCGIRYEFALAEPVR